MIQAEVQKSGAENVLSTIRKFSRRVQGAGLVKTLRAKRYHERDKSRTVMKKRALKLIARRADFQKKVKEGKVAEPVQRRTYSRDTAPAPRPASGSGLGESTPIAR
jgi:ribosomal protein S21